MSQFGAIAALLVLLVIALVAFVLLTLKPNLPGNEFALQPLPADAARNVIYVAERDGGPNGETIVHVWQVEAGPDPTPTATPTGNPPTPTVTPTPTVVLTPGPTAAERLFVPFVQRR